MYTNALLTDFYELTMAAGYLEQGKASDTAVFDLYFRKNPFNGGYSIAAGLEDAVHSIMECRFGKEDLQYLEMQTTAEDTPVVPKKFLEYLASFQFMGNIRAVPEGT
ncbi:MAG: nicotinate phosphoribosyltransferase, partial [Acidobacteriota bacterium]